ncbi:MAG: hypothetical protein H6585_10805 [Flavobacteriales bacterium]|nr:hypothetical protein [Flavobacteriales bacterium]MCB9448822.1 hypothetical protein [Flavobacteriales bacterium]
MDEWLKILPIVLLSTVKFAVAFPVAYGAGLSPWAMWASTVTGGGAGVLCFGLMSERISEWWIRRMHKRHEKHPKRIFTRRNRNIVHVLRHYGLPGIALLTPVLFSIPLGTFLAFRYFHHQPAKVFLYLLASVVLWSSVLSNFGSVVHLIVP